jgi:hypothetical protein
VVHVLVWESPTTLAPSPALLNLPSVVILDVLEEPVSQTIFARGPTPFPALGRLADTSLLQRQTVTESKQIDFQPATYDANV